MALRGHDSGGDGSQRARGGEEAGVPREHPEKQ